MPTKKELPDIDATVGILRRTRNASVPTPMTLDEYQLRGISYKIQFQKGENSKLYGETVFAIVMPANEPEIKFDLLNNPVHAMQWEHLRRLAEAKEYFFEESYPLWEIVEPDKDAKAVIEKFDLEDQATELFKSLKTAEDRKDMATLFNVHYGDDRTITISLRQIIKSSPNVFIEAYHNPNKETVIMVHKAIEANIINRRPDGLYQYGASVLGATVEATIAELLLRQELLPIIRNQVKAKY